MAVRSLGLDQVAPFDPPKKIIEYEFRARGPLASMAVDRFVDEVSSDSPAPGGGSVAALAGSLAAALSAMVARRKGALINVSSVAAFAQNAGNAGYCATKAWMNSFTEGLRLELLRAGSPVSWGLWQYGQSKLQPVRKMTQLTLPG